MRSATAECLNTATHATCTLHVLTGCGEHVSVLLSLPNQCGVSNCVSSRLRQASAATRSPRPRSSYKTTVLGMPVASIDLLVEQPFLDGSIIVFEKVDAVSDSIAHRALHAVGCGYACLRLDLAIQQHSGWTPESGRIDYLVGICWILWSERFAVAIIWVLGSFRKLEELAHQARTAAEGDAASRLKDSGKSRVCSNMAVRTHTLVQALVSEAWPCLTFQKQASGMASCQSQSGSSAGNELKCGRFQMKRCPAW